MLRVEPDGSGRSLVLTGPTGAPNDRTGSTRWHGINPLTRDQPVDKGGGVDRGGCIDWSDAGGLRRALGQEGRILPEGAGRLPGENGGR